MIIIVVVIIIQHYITCICIDQYYPIRVPIEAMVTVFGPIT